MPIHNTVLISVWYCIRMLECYLICSAPEVPEGYRAQFLPGFVEELVVNDDPEYKWIDKIRDKQNLIIYLLAS
jgi:hypothetical protein